jgi:uncharacterized protein
MIIDFTVKNFRSVMRPQAISLIASSLKVHQDHRCEVPGSDEHVLRFSVIYGANAAGKSNLVQAIRFLKILIVEGTKPNEKTGVEPFKLNKEAHNMPSEFEIRFIAQGQIYVFGCEITRDVVCKEWLMIDTGSAGCQSKCNRGWVED